VALYSSAVRRISGAAAVTRKSTSAERPQAERSTSAASGAAEAGAILTIDLAAIRANYRLLCRRAGAARVAAVVKADAYGLGAAQVASALRKEGCDTFFVAHVAEGIALRAALGTGPAILVLNGLPPGAEAACAASKLTPVLNSLDHVAAWSAEARQRRRVLPAALQADTGMNRLGMAGDEVRALEKDARLLDGIDVRLVMSHLACADEPEHPANLEQLRRFKALRGRLPAAPSSLANSSGIFLGERWHFDMVRPGAALYGINPVPGTDNPTHPVVTLQAKVVQVRPVAPREGIGYGHAYHAVDPMRTATISIGYADGWHRRAVAGAFLGEEHLPFVGRVSMDSIILDVTALPEGTPRAGDLVELIGPHQSVDEAAGHAGTIGYEVLTGLGGRFHRIYKDGEAPTARPEGADS